MAPAVWLPGEAQPRNGRCRVHGGLSTGPNTEAGRAAIAESNRRRAEQIRAHRQSMANNDPMHYPEMFWLAVCTWLYRRGLESPNPS